MDNVLSLETSDFEDSENDELDMDSETSEWKIIKLWPVNGKKQLSICEVIQYFWNEGIKMKGFFKKKGQSGAFFLEMLVSPRLKNYFLELYEIRQKNGCLNVEKRETILDICFGKFNINIANNAYQLMVIQNGILGQTNVDVSPNNSSRYISLLNEIATTTLSVDALFSNALNIISSICSPLEINSIHCIRAENADENKKQLLFSGQLSNNILNQLKEKFSPYRLDNVLPFLINSDLLQLDDSSKSSNTLTPQLIRENNFLFNGKQEGSISIKKKKNNPYVNTSGQNQISIQNVHTINFNYNIKPESPKKIVTPKKSIFERLAPRPRRISFVSSNSESECELPQKKLRSVIIKVKNNSSQH